MAGILNENLDFIKIPSEMGSVGYYQAEGFGEPLNVP
jgi:hypothetical protein